MEAGNCIARAKDWFFGESQLKRTPFIAVNCVAKETGEDIQWTGYLTEKTLPRTVESLRYFGWRGNDLTELLPNGSGRLDINDVELVIELETYNGRSTPKVQWVNGLGSASTATPTGFAEFAASMRGKIVELDAKKGTQAPPPPAVSDDIPF